MDEAEESPPGGGRSGAAGRGGPTTEQVRIAAVEAAVAAGLSEAATGNGVAAAGRDEPREPAEATAVPQVPELPDWVDPPTGQVPRILLEADDEATGGLTGTRGPTWRERATDWDDDLGLGPLDELAEATTDVAGRVGAADFEDPFDFAELDGPRDPVAEAPARPPAADDGTEDEAWAAFAAGDVARVPDAVDGPSPRRARHRATSRRGGSRTRHRAVGAEPERPVEVAVAARRSEEAAPEAALAPSSRRRRAPAAGRRSPLVATVTGVVAGAVAIACFLGGAVPALALVTVVATLAAGEAFATFRRAGRRPVTLAGLLAVAALVVGAYLYGPIAVPVVLTCAVVVSAIWHIAQAVDEPAGADGSSRAAPRAPAADLGATFLVVAWVGVLGAFAGLLLSPDRFPDRHGVAFLLAAILLTVAHDVGSYAAGARLGRHRVLPSVSPNKTWEGLVGGTVLTFVVAAAIVSRIHPIDLGAAVGLAALVCVLGPLGDLTESLVKRDLGVKDMGRILPAHGGFFDRIDAMLFVLPAAYFLFRVAHLS